MAVIEPPVLEIRDVEGLTALTLWRMVRPVDAALVRNHIGALQKLLDLVESAGPQTEPLCPELTNVDTSASHYTITETFCALLDLMAYRINLMPVRDQVEFANIFLGDVQEASSARAVLDFTTLGQFDTLVPAGTEVSTTDGAYVFTTDEDLTIPEGETTGSVAATRTLPGKTLLAPNTLTRLVDTPAFVAAVTNPGAVDSGAEAETADQSLERARNYQRRAERLVSDEDYEDAVFEEVLRRNGVVRMFPFVQAGNWAGGNVPGYATMIVMTPTGLAVSDELQAEIRALFEEQGVGNQVISLSDPQYVDFSVEANVILSSFPSQQAVVAAVEANLRAFYAPRGGNFGRKIARGEIVAEIEKTEGVERVEPVNPAGPILVTPVADTTLAPYQLPRLVNVTINVVP